MDKNTIWAIVLSTLVIIASYLILPKFFPGLNPMFGRQAAQVETEYAEDAEPQELDLSAMEENAAVFADADPEEGWPTLTIAALLGHDITDILPEYTGANNGFRLLNDYFGTAVQVMVEEGTEDAAIAAYEDILLANDYSKQGLYYYSKHQQIIVDVYCGTEGSITIDFRRNPHTDTFPLDDLNGFLTAYDFGFTLSEPLVDPSGNGFEVTSGTDGGLHYYRIQVSGNRLSSYKSVLGPILTDAGYTLAQSTSNKVVYKNDDDRQIQIIYSSSSTYVSFYE